MGVEDGRDARAAAAACCRPSWSHESAIVAMMESGTLSVSVVVMRALPATSVRPSAGIASKSLPMEPSSEWVARIDAISSLSHSFRDVVTELWIPAAAAKTWPLSPGDRRWSSCVATAEAWPPGSDFTATTSLSWNRATTSEALGSLSTSLNTACRSSSDTVSPVLVKTIERVGQVTVVVPREGRQNSEPTGPAMVIVEVIAYLGIHLRFMCCNNLGSGRL